MSSGSDPREWRFLRLALVVVPLVFAADAAAWKLYDRAHPPPTRLESSVSCLVQHGVTPVVPAGDPLADSTADGSFRAVIEGNGVTAALASSDEEAAWIARYYRDVGGNLAGRLDRGPDGLPLAVQGVADPAAGVYDCGISWRSTSMRARAPADDAARGEVASGCDPSRRYWEAEHPGKRDRRQFCWPCTTPRAGHAGAYD